ncbi:matrix metalloproteinase-17b [Thunnus maccoyii]|uniref:matrix metalloproteinase-17b n=1 Tax=Thunnus maccoyii TaxID=8240 RepID=UPI001C4D172D|nr:matrix metalloproteinase-17b [Thunnus maccoyii]XP_042275344.1 matrix metalloproteinase-17b [Thunnus maccoyii]XP_042275345.1 matrix metalloproteinase-17b [Thunnus maccoyii]
MQKHAAKMKTWIIFLCLSNGWMQTASTAGVTPTPSSAPVAPTEDESSQLVDWLMKYGYLPPSDPSTGQLQAWTAVTNAVRAMQRFAGLKDTGIVDEETMALMSTPRCSLPDQEEPSKSLTNQEERNMRRRKRAISMWTRKNINWRLHSYPSSSHLSRETIRSLVFYALRVWAEPTPLEFHEVGSPESADLQVDFLHGYHGDGYPFDGAGGAVGHAFFPSDPDRAGGVHLDAEEEWVFRQPASEGTDLFTVLVHEFGHALGLAHSSSRHSVMRPYYQGPAGDPLHYRLGSQDLEHITQLYGKRNQLLATDAPRIAPEPQLRHRGHHYHHRYGPSIDRCNTSFDAVARIRGETFFFKGLMMWRVSGEGLVSGRGASVRRLWRGLPSDLQRLHAVLERQSDHAIIFISGSQFWLFRDLTLQEGYPQPLSALRMGVSLAGADDDVEKEEEEEEEDGAAGRRGLIWDPEEGPVWGEKGDAEKAEQDDTWTQLLREGVSGITTHSDGSVYLFRGDSYWKFMFPGSTPQDGYPRSSAADWLDCPNSSSSPVVDDLSLSLSPRAGRQELRERWREEREKEEAGGRRRDHGRDGHGHKHKDRQDRGPHIRTQCTCQNGALGGRTTSFIAALLLGTWTLLAI